MSRGNAFRGDFLQMRGDAKGLGASGVACLALPVLCRAQLRRCFLGYTNDLGQLLVSWRSAARARICRLWLRHLASLLARDRSFSCNTCSLLPRGAPDVA